MKRRSALVLCVILGAARAGAEPPTHAVIADVGLHVVGAGYQQTVSPHLALQIALESYTPWTQEDQFFELTGFVVRARPVLYKQVAPTGWWLSPFVQAGIGSGKRDGMSKSGFVGAAGVSIGYAWLVWNHVHIAVGAGVQYDVAKIPGGDSRPSFSELWPQLDGTLGFAF